MNITNESCKLYLISFAAPVAPAPVVAVCVLMVLPVVGGTITAVGGEVLAPPAITLSCARNWRHFCRISLQPSFLNLRTWLEYSFSASATILTMYLALCKSVVLHRSTWGQDSTLTQCIMSTYLLRMPVHPVSCVVAPRAVRKIPNPFQNRSAGTDLCRPVITGM